MFCTGLLFAQCPGCTRHHDSCCASQTKGVTRTPQTECLLSWLKETAAQGQFMFGHHDDTVYGIGWVVDGASCTGDNDRSDVRSLLASLLQTTRVRKGHFTQPRRARKNQES